MGAQITLKTSVITCTSVIDIMFTKMTTVVLLFLGVQNYRDFCLKNDQGSKEIFMFFFVFQRGVMSWQE